MRLEFDTQQIDTPHGPAAAQLHPAAEGRAVLLLGHGAGGGITAPDLLAATRAATEAGVHVALIEQPYRVAGRRAPAPAGQLDTAWLAVAAALAAGEFAGLPLVFGGRSSGARVACRTARAGGAAGVLCLAFPLQPAQRDPAKPPRPSRQSELDGAGVPVLVVQGVADPFGCPEPAGDREVLRLRGDHSLKAEHPALRAAVTDWLTRTLSAISA